MSQNRLEELSSIIAAKTKQISECLTAKSFPLPTFDVNGPSKLPDTAADEELQQARHELINATQELHDLAVGPADGLRFLAWGVRPPTPFGTTYAMPTATKIMHQAD